jgi:carboxylesterase type B
MHRLNQLSVKCCGQQQQQQQQQCSLMTWLHPGNFVAQDASPQKFGPQLWMDHGVVLVTVNYRLGPLGFLTLETNDLPGNLGLRDQALALQWIKSEASNFCGNPDANTVFGSGSGGTSAFLQMLSPLNRDKGLFRRVISQSGSPTLDPMFTLRDRKKAAFNLAHKVGCQKKEVRQKKHIKSFQTRKLIAKGNTTRLKRLPVISREHFRSV